MAWALSACSSITFDQNPDGSLFLEGEGGVPAVQAPITLDTVTDLEENDPIREVAIAEILE
jgi:hypothetical protein